MHFLAALYPDPYRIGTGAGNGATHPTYLLSPYIRNPAQNRVNIEHGKSFTVTYTSNSTYRLHTL